MSVFKVFNSRNLILRSLGTLPQASSMIFSPRIFQSKFRQFTSVSDGRIFLAINSLKSLTPSVMPSRGLKSKGKLQLRCKDCYFERRDGEMYVFCNSYGRHNQILKKWRNKKFGWILSYAFVSKVRPY